MQREIRVLNETGLHVLRYICLPENGYAKYFGGNTRADAGLDIGPHVWKSAESMMTLFARLANIPDLTYPYQVESNDLGDRISLTPEGVRADEMARVLGIPVEQVIKHYGLLLKLTDQPV